MRLLFVSLGLLIAAPDHDERPKPTDRPNVGPTGGIDDCPVLPSELVSLANGLGGPIDRAAGYLTSRACTDNSYHFGSEMIPQVRFRDSGPYGFIKESALGLERSRFETAGEVELRLLKRLDIAIRESPLTIADMDLVSQVTALSPKAGRRALGRVIQSELTKEATPDLPARLVRLGAGLEAMWPEIGQNVMETTVLAQAESLRNILSNLAGAAGSEPSLAETFNRAATFVEQGVVKGDKIFEKKGRVDLSGALFWGIYDSVNGSPSLEPGTISLNDALERLTRNIQVRLPKQLDALTILAKTENQPAIARVLASSMDSANLELKGEGRDLLLRAAGHYDLVAWVLQEEFMKSWESAWNSAARGEIAAFNVKKREIFSPLAEGIMGISPELIKPEFVASAIRRGLIGDAVVEARLPKLVLNRLLVQYESSDLLSKESTAEGIFSRIGVNLKDQLALQTTYVPILNGWIERQTRE